MKKKSIVLIVALESELDPQLLPPDLTVVYTGVGKINASIATYRAVHKYNPDLILNYGTVGKITPTLSGLIPIHSVVQRDMIAEPLAPRGTVPFSDKPNILRSSIASSTDSNGSIAHLCGTGDSFVTARDEWLIANKIDVVDMELFAIASVAHEHKLDWVSYKFISDDANEASAQEWSKQVHRGQTLFLKQLRQHL